MKENEEKVLHAAAAAAPANDAIWLEEGNYVESVTDPFLGTRDNADLVIKTHGTERMRIDKNGAVAIQGVPIASAGQTHQMRIDATGKLHKESDAAAATRRQRREILSPSPDGGTDLNPAPAEHNRDRRSVSTNAPKTEVAALHIATNKNIGIGTQKPKSRLHVAGTSTFASPTNNVKRWTTDKLAIDMQQADDDVYAWRVKRDNKKTELVAGIGWNGSADAAMLGTKTEHDLRLMTGHVIGMVIKGDNSTGAVKASNVGIGINEPEAKLHVAGTTKLAAPIEPQAGESSETNKLAVDIQQAGENTYALRMQRAGKTTELVGGIGWNGDAAYLGTKTNHDFRLMTGDSGAINIKGKDDANNPAVKAHNVGIGMQHPEAKLHVAGDVKIGLLEIQQSDLNDPDCDPLITTKDDKWLRIDAKHGIGFWGDGKAGTAKGATKVVADQKPRVFIAPSGNMSVGAGSTPVAKLHVAKGDATEVLRLEGLSEKADAPLHVVADEHGNIGYAIKAVEKGTSWDNAGENATTGKLGIGTNEPEAKLHVVGTTKLAAPIEPQAGESSETNKLAVDIQQAGEDTYALRMQRAGKATELVGGIGWSGDSAYLGTKTNHDFRLMAGNGAAMAIKGATVKNAAGKDTSVKRHNVGIGTFAPEAKLHIVGTTATEVLKLEGLPEKADAPLQIVADEQGNIGYTTHSITGWSKNGTIMSVADGVPITRRDYGGTINRISCGSVNVDTQIESNKGWIGTESDHDFALMTNNSGRVFIKPNGNVGVGVREPAAKLHVDGTVILQNLPEKEDAAWDVVITKKNELGKRKKPVSSDPVYGQHQRFFGKVGYDVSQRLERELIPASDFIHYTTGRFIINVFSIAYGEFEPYPQDLQCWEIDYYKGGEDIIFTNVFCRKPQDHSSGLSNRFSTTKNTEWGPYVFGNSVDVYFKIIKGALWICYRFDKPFDSGSVFVNAKIIFTMDMYNLLEKMYKKTL